MPFLIPLLIGAGGTGYLWYKSSQQQQEEPTFQSEVFQALKIIAFVIVGLLLLRWLWTMAAASKNTVTDE